MQNNTSGRMRRDEDSDEEHDTLPLAERRDLSKEKKTGMVQSTYPATLPAPGFGPTVIPVCSSPSYRGHRYTKLEFFLRPPKKRWRPLFKILLWEGEEETKIPMKSAILYPWLNVPTGPKKRRSEWFKALTLLPCYHQASAQPSSR